MLPAESFQSRHRKLLEAFFKRRHPEQPWGFGECAGFLFAVQCAPEFIPPSEWLPMVLEDIQFETEAEGEQVVGALMALYNWIGERIEHEQLPIPPGYQPHEHAMGNFSPESAFFRWGTGLMAGHDWLEEVWAAHVPHHEEISMGVIMPVGFFQDLDQARDWYRRFFDQKQSFEAFAGQLLAMLPRVLAEYAKAGRQALRAGMQRGQQPARSDKVGRNEPCPCGSGKKHKKCCLGRERQQQSENPASTVGDDIMPELKGRDFSSLAELDSEIQRITRCRNQTPRAEFHGLNPAQMARLFQHPFDAPELLRFANCLKHEPEAPILGLIRRIVDGIGEQGLKATAKGNLPRQFCIDALDEHASFTRNYPFAEFTTLRSETDYPDLHHARLVAEFAGLIEVHKGRFRVCQTCREMLARSGYRELYPRLFRTFVEEYNWAYGDGFPEWPLAQHSFAFTLYLLQRFGADWRDPEFYEDAFLTAFPSTVDMLEDDLLETAEQVRRRIYRFRVLLQFAEFLGLVEVERGHDDPLDRNIRLRCRPLIDELVQFTPMNPDSGGLH